MQEMFDLVDVDGSGEISKDEFAKLYRQIADTVRADVAKEQALGGEDPRSAPTCSWASRAPSSSSSASRPPRPARHLRPTPGDQGGEGRLGRAGSPTRTAASCAPPRSKVYPNATDAHMKSVKYLEFNFEAAFTTTGMDMRLQLPVEGWSATRARRATPPATQWSRPPSSSPRPSATSSMRGTRPPPPTPPTPSRTSRRRPERHRVRECRRHHPDAAARRSAPRGAHRQQAPARPARPPDAGLVVLSRQPRFARRRPLRHESRSSVMTRRTSPSSSSFRWATVPSKLEVAKSR